MNAWEIKAALKTYSNFHKQGDLPNYFVFSLPRSGSTWLMELLATQPGFKFFNEPLYLDNKLVQNYLKINDWAALYEESANEKFYKYFDGIIKGKIGFLNPNPFTSFYRLKSSRIVFKIIHAGDDRINWFRDTFNGKIIYLVRHPIAVSLSRKKVSNLDASLNSSFSKNFNADQLAYAKMIVRSGTFLHQRMLSWCMRVSVVLRQRTADWAFVTYEQTVMNPSNVVEHLVKKVGLVDRDKFKNNLFVPSRVKHQSSADTQKFLESSSSNREYLISKWKDKVTDSEEGDLMEMLKVFDIDIYRSGQVMPVSNYMVS
jgi:hypothetical protein